jgi:hypothetical protein
MTSFQKGLLTVLLVGALTGCATQGQVRTYKIADKKQWEIGQGPTVSEIVNLPQESIDTIAKRGAPQPPVKEKFETEEEFRRRSAVKPPAIFVVAPIVTTKGANCETSYDHDKGTYSVKQCLPFLSSRPITSIHREGESFGLANAYDSRTIKRNIWEKYFLSATVDWSHELKISKDVAKEIDNDLMAGLVLKEFAVAKSCSLCSTRDLSDALAGMSKAMSGRSSKGWRDTAFREGEILEDWDYRVGTSGFEEMVVFRKSDQRVLYRARYILNTEEIK